MEAAREYASLLGLDLSAHPDLAWLARRAMAAKLPEGWEALTDGESGEPYYFDSAANATSWEPPTEAHFVELARVATLPWPLLAELEPYLGCGWASGVATAPFAAEDPEELGFAAGDTLLVSCDERAAEGWWRACTPTDTSRLGLVPKGYVALNDFAVRATAAFEATSPGELSFAAGDVIGVRPGAGLGPSWWLGLVDGKRGYVPRYVLDADWRQNAALAAAALWRAHAVHTGSMQAAEALQGRAATVLASRYRGHKARTETGRIVAERQQSERASRIERARMYTPGGAAD